MQLCPFYLDKLSDIYHALPEVKSAMAMMGESASMLVTFFGCRKTATLMLDAARVVRREFPQAHVAGAVSDQEILNGKISSTHVSVAFTLFQTSSVRLFIYDFHHQDSMEAGRAFVEQLKAMPDLRAIELIATGEKLDMMPFLREMDGCPENVAVFGGISADNGSGPRGLLFADDQIGSFGVLGLAFCGRDLQVSVNSSFGWKPLGQELLITRMKDPYTIQEINHRPAIEVYQRYLGLQDGDDFMMEMLTFPFYLERDGVMLARHPRVVEPDGSVYYAADLYEGEKIHLSYGDPQAILDKADELQIQMADFRPQAVSFVSCMARSLLLRGDTEKELHMSTYSPSQGFFAYGEFLRHGGSIMVSNMTLVMVGMREGKASMRPFRLPKPQSHFDERTSIMRHLVTFIQTTIGELEETKERYRELARRDLMTGLFNRGTMDLILRQVMDDSAEQHEPLALIMLDIDNFKEINDSFGHDAGDKALRAVAAILQNNTRRGIDAPGRMGGDEFFVLLRNSDGERAREIAQRVHDAVMAVDVLPEHHAITTSIGIAVAQPGDTAAVLLKRMDNALYTAKRREGKNSIAER